MAVWCQVHLDHFESVLLSHPFEAPKAKGFLESILSTCVISCLLQLVQKYTNAQLVYIKLQGCRLSYIHLHSSYANITIQLLSTYHYLSIYNLLHHFTINRGFKWHHLTRAATPKATPTQRCFGFRSRYRHQRAVGGAEYHPLRVKFPESPGGDEKTVKRWFLR